MSGLPNGVRREPRGAAVENTPGVWRASPGVNRRLDPASPPAGREPNVNHGYPGAAAVNVNRPDPSRRAAPRKTL